MLEIRPNCECCDKDLPADSDQAMICSFECTFCQTCMDTYFNHQCPNCGGSVSPRPSRVGAPLKRNPVSTKRVLSDYQIEIKSGQKTVTRTRIL